MFPLRLRLLLLPLMQFKFSFGCCFMRCPLIIFLLLIPLPVGIWPGLVPFRLFQFWGWWGSPLDLAILVCPILVIGLLLTLTNTPSIHRRADSILVYARNWLLFSLQAGPIEELVYRWLFFYGAMLCLPLVNFVTFGLVQWLYTTFLGPLADLFTLHQLHDILLGNQSSWVVGMAVISTNGGFRDAHAYQNRLGWIWAWFGGMFLFLILFRHGLFAAMLVHSFYNVCIFALNWLIARLYMTPEEAQELVEEKLRVLQEVWPAGAYPVPARTVEDSAPPYSSPSGTPPESINPRRIPPARSLIDSRSGSASWRRRFKRENT